MGLWTKPQLKWKYYVTQGTGNLNGKGTSIIVSECIRQGHKTYINFSHQKGPFIISQLLRIPHSNRPEGEFSHYLAPSLKEPEGAGNQLSIHDCYLRNLIVAIFKFEDGNFEKKQYSSVL